MGKKTEQSQKVYNRLCPVFFGKKIPKSMIFFPDCTGNFQNSYSLTEEDKMKLKNVLIVVNDMKKSIAFYKELFGLDVVLDNDGNVILTEGLVLQDAAIWKKFIDKNIVPENNAAELYFEEPDIEGFAKKLDAYGDSIHYVNRLMEHSWGQKVIRFYDPDGNLIEVGTPMK